MGVPCSARSVAAGLRPPPPSPARGAPPAPPLAGIREGTVARLLARLEGWAAPGDRRAQDPAGTLRGPPLEPARGRAAGVARSHTPEVANPGRLVPEQGGAGGAGEGGGSGQRRRWYGSAETERIARILRSDCTGGNRPQA